MEKHTVPTTPSEYQTRQGKWGGGGIEGTGRLQRGRQQRLRLPPIVIHMESSYVELVCGNIKVTLAVFCKPTQFQLDLRPGLLLHSCQHSALLVSIFAISLSWVLLILTKPSAGIEFLMNNI